MMADLQHVCSQQVRLALGAVEEQTFYEPGVFCGVSRSLPSASPMNRNVKAPNLSWMTVEALFSRVLPDPMSLRSAESA